MNSDEALPRQAVFRVARVTAVVFVTLGVIASLLFVGNRQFRREMQNTYCAVNLRGVHQGFELFAMNNWDRYPLPSVIDKAGNTVGGEASGKNTTANIVSSLIYGTFFGPESCISPAEPNPAVKPASGYQPKAPVAAINPALAEWDPAFAADFTAPGGGNFSYTHQRPSERGPRWTRTQSGTDVVLADRAPKVLSVTKGAGESVVPTLDPTSLHRPRHPGMSGDWCGHVAFGDSHVTGVPNVWAEHDGWDCTYVDSTGGRWVDIMHFDEPDDPKGVNSVLGIFATAGPTPAAFRSIWD